MKTKTLTGVFLSLMMMFSVCSCNDDAEIILFSGSAPNIEAGTCWNQISSTNLFLNGRLSQDIGIANGKGGYSAQSSDETVVTATVKDNRLLINSHNKKGKVTVTVSDQKGNSTVLSVRVSYGIVSLQCQEQYTFVAVDGKYVEDEELQKQVSASMKPVLLMEEKGLFEYQPVDISDIMNEQDCGTFTIYDAKKGKVQEGAYSAKWDDTLTGKKEYALVLNPGDNERILYINPNSIASTRDLGPLHLFYIEDITSLYQGSVKLPENGKVLNAIEMVGPRVQPQPAQ